MAPFGTPAGVITGFKERAEALTVQGDKLYVGTATGSLHVYSLPDTSDGETQLVDTKKGLSRRAIEQLGYVKDVNSLAVLTDGLVTLYPLPSFAPHTPLAKSKGALSFAIYTGPASPRHEENGSKGDLDKLDEIPSVITYLAIGCRRKMVLYSWKDGEPQEVLEALLPHSPRTMAFIDINTICFGYQPPDYSIFSIKTMSCTDFSQPVASTSSTAGISNMGRGALSGLGGYVGLGTKPKPTLIAVKEGEALVAKDNTGIFLGSDATTSRTSTIDWPAPPEELAFVSPYIFAVMPAGTVPAHGENNHTGTSSVQLSFIPSPVIDIRSSLSLLSLQSLPFPPVAEGGAQTPPHTVRLLTTAPSAKSPLFLVTTPTERIAAANGSTIWRFDMKPWDEQVEELVAEEEYTNALALLDSIDAAILPEKDKRIRHVRALNAVAQFRAGKFDDAITTFLELDINPAKVVALYPESISGRLHVPQDEWIPLFGGPAKDTPSQQPAEETKEGTEGSEPSRTTSPAPATSPPRPPSPRGSIRGMLRSGLESVRAAAGRDDSDTASISDRGKRKERKKDSFQLSVEALLRYLSEGRRKATGALNALGIASAQSHTLPALSATSVGELLALPDARLSALAPAELVRFAQTVDTALFKSYLLVRPGLLGPLCRQPNWCEVSEVEEVLRAREKFSELIYLYNGKRMHDKALDLLRHLSEKETDKRDKLQPSVTYLQRLGPEYTDQIFESSRWIFEQDSDIGLEIFTSEEAELPRQRVTYFLEKIDMSVCTKYIEHLIAERGEESQVLHDRLAELYLRMTLAAKKSGNKGSYDETYAKFLKFLDATDHYHVDRLYGLLPQEDLFEAKAILLGRLGRHDAALELYVYRLQDYAKAEAYCTRVYAPSTPTASIFLTLLRTYLAPTHASALPPGALLPPALELIARHAPRLDAIETLALLPPLVAAADVRDFLKAAAQAPRVDTRVVREIAKSREDQVARRLIALQSRRVRVTDSRICPQCSKRIGYSVIAVHAPRGEVTHYQCREAFSRKLKELAARR